jgi:predicted DNA-binding transcriptional regulator
MYNDVKKYLLLRRRRVFARDIAKEFDIRKERVYRIVRSLIEDGFGIETTNRGYVVSKYATQKDDVNFLAKFNGQLRNVDIRLRASYDYIVKRWPNKQLDMCLHNMFDFKNGLNKTSATYSALLNLAELLDPIDEASKKTI